MMEFAGSERAGQPSVFISHIHDDQAIAVALSDAVTTLLPELVVAYSTSPENLKNGIGAGNDWSACLNERVRNALFLVMLVTPASISRPWTLWEAVAASAEPRRIYPIIFRLRLEDIPSPLNNFQMTRGDDFDDMSRMLHHWAQELGTSQAQLSRRLASVIHPYLDTVNAILETRDEPPFDLFLSYRSTDERAVRELAGRLERDGIRTWMDTNKLKAGDEFSPATQKALARADAVAVFVGRSGIGGMQKDEVESSLRRKAAEGDRFRLIPVILPNTSPALVPPELARYRWVNFGSSLDDPEAYSLLKNTILGSYVAELDKQPVSKQSLDVQDTRMLCELLFRLVVRLRERPEMLQSLDATAFWAAVRKIRPSASTIEDLRAVNAELSTEPAPGPLWAAWVRNVRAIELAAILQHPDMTQVSA
jgi:TIR domain